MTTQSIKSRVHIPSARLSLKSGLRSSLKKPAPLNPDEFQPLLSASLKVQFSPLHFPQSPRSSPRSAHSPNSNDRTKIVVPPTSAPISPWRLDRESEIVDPEKLEEVQYAFETTKLPADVPTATFDYPMPSKFSSSESSASDSDDSPLEVEVGQRSVRFAIQVPHSPIPRARTQQEIYRALSFLPAPVSPFPRSSKLRPSRLKIDNQQAPAAKSLAVPSKGTSTQPGGGARTRVIRRPARLFVGEPGEFDTPRFAPPGLIGQPKLSPVVESPDLNTPSVTVECPSSDENSDDSTDSTTSTLSTAFWSSVSVQQSPGVRVSADSDSDSPSSPPAPKDSFRSSVKVPPIAIPSPAFFSPQPSSPYPLFLFGRSDGTFWTPEVPRTRVRTRQPDYAGHQFPLSPATTVSAAKTFEMMMSPAPNDPLSSFPSILSALDHIDADELIAFPPSVELRDPPSPRVMG